MKDERIDRVADELTEIIRQWFAEKRHLASRCELAQQSGSGTGLNQDQSETVECALRDMELVLMTIKASLAALKKSPSGESHQQYLEVLVIQVSELDIIVNTFSSALRTS